MERLRNLPKLVTWLLRDLPSQPSRCPVKWGACSPGCLVLTLYTAYAYPSSSSSLRPFPEFL